MKYFEVERIADLRVFRRSFHKAFKKYEFFLKNFQKIQLKDFF